MSVGEKIKLILEEKGMRQKVLASKMDENPTHLSKILNNHRTISMEFLKKFLVVFPDTDLNWLLRDEKESNLTEVSEPKDTYNKDSAHQILNDVEEKLNKLREFLPQK